MPNLINVIQDTSELTRRGFVTNYPHFRHWRKEAGEERHSPKALSVYTHLPYFLPRWAYSPFKKTTLCQTELAQIARYVEALDRQIEMSTDHFNLLLPRTLA